MKEKGRLIMLGALFGAAFVICLLLLWKIWQDPLLEEGQESLAVQAGLTGDASTEEVSGGTGADGEGEFIPGPEGTDREEIGSVDITEGEGPPVEKLENQPVGGNGEANNQQPGQQALRNEYEAMEERFESIERREDIGEAGYTVIEDQVFLHIFETFGENEIVFIPAMENQYHRLAVFLADAEGTILWKTDQLETNYSFREELAQPNKGIAAVSFQDLNRDGLTDIVLISNCENETGNYAGTPYKVGDVLYQEEGSFYRDWRISDQINRFGMNKSVDFIVACARDGYSTEFLYTATSLQELLDNGFEIFEQQHYKRNFEKLGTLEIVPGVYSVAEYDIFMIYLVNEEGYIAWSFQPMEDYDSLFSMMGMLCLDLDGDGMKDLVIQARFSYEGPNEELVVDTRCLIYYQRTDGFVEDTEFEKLYQFTEKDRLKDDIVVKIRDFWGWEVEKE